MFVHDDDGARDGRLSEEAILLLKCYGVFVVLGVFLIWLVMAVAKS
ncbi:MAG TPA: hypothetical protein VNJ04_11920 [Gemmatimonadaceae bacterium]|nr:hypothetical protein [Gemmatimonadaceae bacterium]